MSMTDREYLRFALATLAYRASKTMRDAPESFAAFKADPGSNTPLVIVGHMADLFAWAYTMTQGEPKWHYTPPVDWSTECARFFTALKAVDDVLASDAPIAFDLTRMFAGPVADALTHTGQLAMIRRLAGCPMKGENYSRATIEIGRVGADQTGPDSKNEF
ncbi:hypothetical protein KQH82_13840 [bacterium]|nr:hypothetical protein [bacterium]